MNGGSMTPPDDDPLGPVVESFLDRFRRGERPAMTELIARHPELATRIRELIPALVELEQLGASSGSLTPPSRYGPFASESGDASPSPERLGDYLILRRIDGGGMGVVYEAEHLSLKNRVALKVMQPRFRADRKYSQRFHAEARLAAGLHHTNIVGVFDYGEQDGVCFYAMQFIEGQPLDRVLADIRRLRDDHTHAESLVGPDGILTIPATAAARGLLTGRFAVETDRDLTTTANTACSAEAPAANAIRAGDPEAGPEECDGREPSTLESSSLGRLREPRYCREIARVGVQVADALEYAHRRGVLHRDIKPSNLLLDAMGNVWVTDFGLAKLVESADLSQSRELVGTLRYMAPERFRGTSDRRGDIYSLGATLYELLALRPPFEENDQIRLIERIRNDPPLPPRQLDRTIPRDLETIVLKALAKDPHDRFDSAGDLAAELRRFVEGRPIRSRPVSAFERFWRWCRREPWLAGANIAAALLMIVLAAAATAAAIVFRNQAEALRLERARSDDAALNAEWRAVDAYTAQARNGLFSRRQGQRFETLKAVSQAAKLLEGLPPGTGSAARRDSLRDLAIAALALPDLKPAGRVIHRPRDVIATSFDPTLTRYALRFRDGAISVRRALDDQEIDQFRARGVRDARLYGFSPDGRYLAAGHQPGGAVTIRDIDGRALALNDPGPISYVRAIQFTPDGRRLILARTDGALVVHDLANRRIARQYRGTGPARGLAIRPDGGRIAVLYDEKTGPACVILETETGRQVSTIALPPNPAGVAWSPDGTALAIPFDDRKIMLWDAAGGIRTSTLEGHTAKGVQLAFHPAGTLLISNGWEGRLWLWDAILGRNWLTVTGESNPEMSRDGRVVVSLEDKLTTYQVDPALEYRTFAHISGRQMDYQRPTIRHDGRLLAVGTDQGVVLWDLARGTELAFAAIGTTWNVMFESSGDLITSGALGVNRWPIRLDSDGGESGMGPPRGLALPLGYCGIAQDRSGRIVAKADYTYAYVTTPELSARVGPLVDCRRVAVSPDGQWLATGTHIESRGAQVWRTSDFQKVADLPLDYGSGGVTFSPDGKWLMTENSPCRLWEVGTWREARQIGGHGYDFSPDGRLVVVQDDSKIFRLVETETGRTLARLESPDLCQGWAAFSPDGSRIVVTTNDGPAVHVWDLRAIRKQLAGMHLDWDAPAYSDLDPARASLALLTPLRVKYGFVPWLDRHFDDRGAVVLERYTARLMDEPNDADALHHRAHAYATLLRYPEAIDDLTRAIHLRPDDAHYRAVRGTVYRWMKQYQPASADLEAAVALEPEQWLFRQSLAFCCNNLAWPLANGPVARRDLDRAVALARRAVELAPGEGKYLNTMGVVLYRAGHYAEAIVTLERSRAANRGRLDGFDFFFQAMAHHRLGHGDQARESLDHAARWQREPKNLDGINPAELVQFRAEAEAVLAGPSSELPEKIFARAVSTAPEDTLSAQPGGPEEAWS